MPRCLLVKKYYGSKRSNLSELGCQNDILSEQYPLEELVAANTSLPVACFTTGLVWDVSLVQSLQVSTSLSPLSTTQGPMDLSSPSNCTSRDEDNPPSPEPVVTYRAQHQKAPCDSKSKQWAKKDQGEVPVPITAPSFLCKHCSKQYNSLGALKMHIRSHIMPCVCPTCGKAFSRPWLLRGHIRTHTGERPFSCTHCNRAFADRSNLRAHLQTHVDVKKYQCSTCSRTFSRMSLLQKHKVAGCCPLTV